jgi:signal transduction histidine kinase
MPRLSGRHPWTCYSARNWEETRTIRRLWIYLLGLVLAAALPILALSIGMAWRNIQLEREAAGAELQRLAASAATVVDAHLARATLLLEALARSPDLLNGEFHDFEQHLRSVAADTGIVLLLANRAGEQVINSATPHGTMLKAPPRPDVVERTLAGGKPDLSNVITGPIANRPVAGLLVAVPNGTADAAAVGARIDPLQLAAVLAGPDHGQQTFVIVYDGNGKQFASTAPAGVTVPSLPNQAARLGTDTQWPAITALGYAAAIEPVRGTSWHVAVLAPAATLAAKWQTTMNWLIAVGSVVIALAILIAVLLGRFLVREAGTLVSEARMAVEGSLPPTLKSVVYEFAVLRNTLRTVAEAAREAIFTQARLAGLVQTATQLESRVAQRTQELEETTGRLLNAQDDERRRIAREMHDSSVQELIAATLHLQSVRVLADGRSARELEEARAALDRVKEELRTVAFLMQPPLLDECGIVTALRVYAEGFSRRSGIEITVDAPEQDPALPRAVETALFRVAQEALTNVHRHANCTTGRIRLAATPQEIVLEVADEGRGMPSGDRTAVGVGITGMRARVRQLGGNLTITSAEAGTTLCVTMPLPAVQLTSSAA